MFKYYLYRFGQFLVNRLSLNASYKMATVISDLHYFFSFRDRRAVCNNLKKIFKTDKVPPQQVRDVFRNFGKYLSEFLAMERRIDKSFVDQKIRIKNIERIDEVLDKGKGGIILTAHIGNWELGAVLLSMLGYPLMAVALPHKERPVNDLFNHQREVKGMTVVATSGAIIKCMEHLKNNKLVAIVGDRDFSIKGGEVMDFLGHKTLLPKGAAVFSDRTGAAIIPTFLIREEDDTFTLSICEPIYPLKTTGSLADEGVIVYIMKRYIAVIQEKIQEYPTQWLMFREFCVNDTKQF